MAAPGAAGEDAKGNVQPVPNRGVIGQGEAGGDEIIDLDQDGGGTSLPVVGGDSRQGLKGTVPHGMAHRGNRDAVTDLVAAQRLEADWLEDMDAVDDPAQPGAANARCRRYRERRTE